MTITVAGLNPVEIRGGILRVDRKFHSGMMNYCQSLPGIVALNPKPMPGEPIMDPIEVKLTELPYTVEVAESTGDPWQAASHEWDRLRAIVRRTRLVYGCGLSVPQIARELGVPYILVLEFDLQTKLTILRVEAGDLLRRFVRQARCLRDHILREIPITRAARLVQCNGYPIYDQTARHNGSRLLEDQSMLARMSENARRFALEHCFEREFDKRVRAITEQLS